MTEIEKDRHAYKCLLGYMANKYSDCLQKEDLRDAAKVSRHLYSDEKISVYIAVCNIDKKTFFPGIVYKKTDKALLIGICCGKINIYQTDTQWTPEFNDLVEYISGNGWKPEAAFTMDEIYKAANYVKLFLFGDKIKNACLFTGAFNPPTIAHYHMADTVMSASVNGNENCKFDFIIYATSTQEFLEKKLKRKGETMVFSEKQRVNLLLEMTKDRPDILVHGVECGYTYDVLKEVKETYGIENLYFALGSDKLHEIYKWGHHDKLLREFSFFVLQRDENADYIEKKCNDIFCNTNYITSLSDTGCDTELYKDVSATQVRNMIKNNGDYSKLVTPNVYNALQLCLKMQKKQHG